MRSLFTAVSLLALVLPALSAPTRLIVKKANGPSVVDSYIVTLKSGSNLLDHISSLQSTVKDKALHEIVYQYDAKVLHGYSAKLRGTALEHVLASNDVESVEQDGIVTSTRNLDKRDSSWGGREDASAALDKRLGCGAGVDIYVIDTGVYLGHNCFGGRAVWGATFGGYANQDGNGSGTHGASIAAGTGFGPATCAKIIAVKVLSDSGSGSFSDVIAGINWAANAAATSGRPSVANVAIGGSANTAVDTAVNNAINSGLHFSVAAGASNVDASNFSPARVAAANTVGTIDSTGCKSSFSNYGSVVDVYAPGVSVKCANIGSPTATIVLSGTSISTAYVTGILAVALGEYGNVTPASLSNSLKSHAKSVVCSTGTYLVAQPW